MKNVVNRMKHVVNAVTVTIVASLSMSVIAEESSDITVKEIVSKANMASYYAGDDGRSDARMIIVDKDGNKQLRQFVILRKDIEDEGDQNFLVVFSRPTDVRGTVFLVNKHVESDDDRWLYLPGLDLVKRISAGDKRTSFVGSDFYYEDVSGRNPKLDEHELVGNNEETFIIKSLPKNKEGVEFSYYQSTISKENFLPVKVEYFNDKDEVYRRMEVVEVETVEGIPTVMKSQISNLDTGSKTLMQFRKPAYNLGIPEEVFTSRSLRNPPKDWIEGQ